jgi:heme/copper-type cytochrome/quinol oxidase subunit 4
MSSVQLHETTKHKADLKRHDYGFVLALICMVLALLVASAIFAPLPVGSEISNQMSLVGP